MAGQRLPPFRERRRRQIFATAAAAFTISIITLFLCYHARLNYEPSRLTSYPFRPFLERPVSESPHSKQEQEQEPMAHHSPHLTKPTLLASLPSSALPKPGAGPNSPRLVIIGDVHGQLHALDALLSKVKFSASHGDKLVFTGDMVNKGPDSAGVVARAMELEAWAVRGNHEDRVLRAWAKKLKRKAKANGNNPEAEETGAETEAEEVEAEKKKLSKSQRADLATAKSLTSAQRTWLAKLPVILRVGTLSPYYGKVVVVHAGLVPGIPLDEQDPDAVMNMRTLVSKHLYASSSSSFPSRLDSEFIRTLHPSEGHKGHPWSKVWNRMQKELAHDSGKKGDHDHDHDNKHAVVSTAIYGHDARTGLSVRRYAFGLDSSCVKGGDLTALVFESVPFPSSSSSPPSDPESEEDEEETPPALAKGKKGGKKAARHGISHRLVSVSCKASAAASSDGNNNDDDNDGGSDDGEPRKGAMMTTTEDL
ncbi:hypothetical protein AAE478_008675 [Parahypoxylon ruwenzoriense]